MLTSDELNRTELQFWTHAFHRDCQLSFQASIGDVAFTFDTLRTCNEYLRILLVSLLPSVFWCCWLGGRKAIRPVENWVVGWWRGYLSGARCGLAYGPADATATHCLAHPASPGQRAVKRVCVCVDTPSWWIHSLSVQLLRSNPCSATRGQGARHPGHSSHTCDATHFHLVRPQNGT